ncbi:nurim homolog [Polistes fuscatus]|uniref:nurim homolog n=1 Tax=Polistes fuscatus TaxID=30207 RepID=UPI001CA942E0|nr:nurim homolog [Polistes fuscatus]
MDAMIRKTFLVILCITSFFYIFFVLRKLIYFLSNSNEHQNTQLVSTEDENLNLSTLWSLLIDSCLLSLFILQHSLMANVTVKNFLKKLYIDEIERSLYNTCSAAVLSFLLDNWQIIPWINIWNIDISNNNILWSTFILIHIFGWFIIYSGCLTMDISELIGFRQVYYKITARPSPMSTKSKELQRYYSHMRHPSFIGFLTILWVHPFMSLDRFLLASILTIYMLLRWSIDKEDYQYHAHVLRCKQREFIF